jgi:hypothetical protein
MGLLPDRLFTTWLDALIVVAQITPMNNSGWDEAARALNAALPEIVKAHAA